MFFAFQNTFYSYSVQHIISFFFFSIVLFLPVDLPFFKEWLTYLHAFLTS